MSKEISKEAIFKYIELWDDFDKNVSEADNSFKVHLTQADKSLIITMPYEVGEFFLDFAVNNQPYYSDWFEIMDDPLSDFMHYTKQVADRFLFNPVQIKTQGWWLFKTHELQYLNHGSWCNVF